MSILQFVASIVGSSPTDTSFQTGFVQGHRSGRVLYLPFYLYLTQHPGFVEAGARESLHSWREVETDGFWFFRTVAKKANLHK